jgi:hypothetical protein
MAGLLTLVLIVIIRSNLCSQNYKQFLCVFSQAILAGGLS